MFDRIRRWLTRNKDRHPWSAIGFHGVGTIDSPFDMTEAEAIIWVANTVQGEIAFIDRECGFIFYRSKKN